MTLLALSAARQQQEPGVSDAAGLALQCLRWGEESQEVAQIVRSAVETIASESNGSSPKTLIGRIRQQARGLDKPEADAAYIRFVEGNLRGRLLKESDVAQKVKDFAKAASTLASGDRDVFGLGLERLDSGLGPTVGASLADLARTALKHEEEAGAPFHQRLELARSALRLIRDQGEPGVADLAGSIS